MHAEMTPTRQKSPWTSAGSALVQVNFCRVSVPRGELLPGQRSLGDGGDVELELDLVRHQEATGLERGVPGQAPLLAVEGGAALEAEAGVAERVLGRAGQLEVDRDRLGDVLDGQVAGDRPVVAVAGDLGGDEGDLGVGLDVEEVGAVQ